MTALAALLLRAAALAGMAASAGAADRTAAAPSLRSHGGETTWFLNLGALRPLGIAPLRLDRRLDDTPPRADYLEWHFAATPDSGFALRLRGARFERLQEATLRHAGGPVLQLPSGTLDLRGFLLQRSGNGPFGLAVADAQGTVWFTLDHAHEFLDAAAGRFAVRHMDLRLAPALAQRLGHAEFAGLLVGGMETTAARLDVLPAGAGETAQCAAPWPTPGQSGGGAWVNVRMIDLATNWEERQPDGVNVYRCGRDDGQGGHSLPCSETSDDGVVVLSPDASLRGEGTAAVAWHPKFSAPSPPYGNDQHPFLVWNLYRLDADGSLRQIGASALKHAFHTINAACGCGQGEVLYPSCEDTYGGFSNDYPSALAPRSEIVPHTAQWGRCGSLYDKDCDGKQDADNGLLPDDAYNPAKRLGVREGELSATAHPGARWFLEYWYVVRDDVDPYDNIGLREVRPLKQRSQGSDPNAWIWRFENLDFRNGPMVDRWVALAPPGSATQVAEGVGANGRVRVAVRATPLAGGRWRYDYAVFNLDYARVVTQGAEPNLRIASHHGLATLSVPVDAVADAHPAAFASVGAEPPWGGAIDARHVSWSVQDGAELEWGRTYVYTLTAALPPAATALVLSDAGSPRAALAVPTLAPLRDAPPRRRPATFGERPPPRS